MGIVEGSSGVNIRGKFVLSRNLGYKMRGLHHRVLTMSHCEWIIYESGHQFFMKASQILYAFVLPNMRWESQTAVLEHLEAFRQFIFV